MEHRAVVFKRRPTKEGRYLAWNVQFGGDRRWNVTSSEETLEFAPKGVSQQEPFFLLSSFFSKHKRQSLTLEF
jgi:hypothetical protein